MKANLGKAISFPNFKISSSSYIKINEEIEDNENIKSKKKKLILFFILIIFLILLFLISLIIFVYKFIIEPEMKDSKKKRNPEIYKIYNEKSKIQKYVDNCIQGILFDQKKYKKSNNPKISIVIPVYNKENFILRVLRSIQNQSFKDIEIVFSDDHSYDNSTNLIEQYQKEDERIVLYKQETNRGTLRNRVDGGIKSKGEYILFLDSDDLLVEKNILKTIYSKAKSNNVDIVQFQAYHGDYYNSFNFYENGHKTEPIYQPELSNLMYYEKGYLQSTENVIWGKLIKRNIFIETINSIDQYYLNQHMTLHDDGLILFILFKKANSYLFIKDYGMIYFYNDKSTMGNMRNKDKINKTVRDCFIYLEFIFNYTNDTLREKNIAVYQFKGFLSGFNDLYKKVTLGFDYIYKVIDLYLNCDIILKEDKKIIQQVKDQFKLLESNMTTLIL